jgi:hypothetical protein
MAFVKFVRKCLFYSNIKDFFLRKWRKRGESSVKVTALPGRFGKLPKYEGVLTTELRYYVFSFKELLVYVVQNMAYIL